MTRSTLARTLSPVSWIFVIGLFMGRRARGTPPGSGSGRNDGTLGTVGGVRDSTPAVGSGSGTIPAGDLRRHDASRSARVDAAGGIPPRQRAGRSGRRPTRSSGSRPRPSPRGTPRRRPTRRPPTPPNSGGDHERDHRQPDPLDQRRRARAAPPALGPGAGARASAGPPSVTVISEAAAPSGRPADRRGDLAAAPACSTRTAMATAAPRPARSR